MCTAISFEAKNRYFGRTLDVERGYGEQIVLAPRRFPLVFRKQRTLEEHPAMLGVALVAEGVPLFFDACNEHGLGMAGLRFVGYAKYHVERQGKDNVAPFELIPWVLGQCRTVQEAGALLSRCHLMEENFNDSLISTPLHWMISDGRESLVIESVREGLKIYENPVGVMTNEPPFPVLQWYLERYVGTESVGIPGDGSSASRFVRAAAVREKCCRGEGYQEAVSAFFHMAAAVARVKGGEEYTCYTSCYDLSAGRIYYTTYENSQVRGVDMHREDIDGCMLSCREMKRVAEIHIEN